MDLLIEGGCVVTVDDDRRVLEGASVAVSGDTIVGVGDRRSLEARHGRARQVVDARGLVVTPGFINAHTHCFQTVYRGLGDGLPFHRWQREVIWPLYEHMSLEDVYAFTLLGAVENLRSGVTCVVNFQAFPNSVEAYARAAAAFSEAGLRAVIVKSFYGQDAPTAFLAAHDRVLAECRETLDLLHGAYEGRIMVWLGPPVPTQAAPDTIVAAHALARERGTGLHIHVAESADLAERARRALGKGEIEFFADLGVLDDGFHAVHCVGLTPREIDLLSQAGAHVIHCPVSNLYLGSGIAPLLRMREAGINVAVGTDGPASNNNQDLLAAVKLASLLAKGTTLDPAALGPGEALELVTANAARALGRNDLGRVAPGARADLALWDLETPFTAPVHRPVSSLIYAALPGCLHSLLVAGRWVFRGGRAEGIDEIEVVREASLRARDLLRRAGHEERVPGVWPWR